MDERTKRLFPSSRDEVSPNDIFAQVVVQERNGRVRMLGGGLAPRDLWTHMPSQKTSYRLSALKDLQIKYKEQAQRIAHLEAMVNQEMSQGLQHNSGVGSTSTAHSSVPIPEPLLHPVLSSIVSAVGCDKNDCWEAAVEEMAGEGGLQILERT